MNSYRIYLKKNEQSVIEDLVLVKEGFNFWAFLLGFAWFYHQKIWKYATKILVLSIVLSILPLGVFSFILFLCLSIYLGISAAEIQSVTLLDNHYEFLGYSNGENESDAKLHFLDKLNQEEISKKSEVISKILNSKSETNNI